MNQLITWPKEYPRVMKPWGQIRHQPIPRHEVGDFLALQRAREIERAMEGIRCSGTTGTWGELMFVNTADYSAFNTSASEGSLLAGVNEQPVVPALYFFNKQGRHRGLTLRASGVLGTTSTPTIIFQVRFGTTSGSAYLSGTSAGVTAAITTASGVSNKWWELQLDLQCNTGGIGTGNTTMSGAGYVTSPSGFATPFIYPLEPTTPDTATWTFVTDNSLTYYINLSVTWSASSPSNTITCKKLWMFGWN